MSSIKWSAAALQDVQRLYLFLLGKDEAVAKRAVVAIDDSVALISTQPNMGRPAANFPDGFREWLVSFGASGYVVLYRLHHIDVFILALRHQKELDDQK